MAVKIAGYSEGMTHADFTARMGTNKNPFYEERNFRI